MKSILFICSANKDRSKTAEDFFSEQFPDLKFDSAGTNQKICNQLGTNYMSQEQLDRADLIFVMEQKHTTAITKLFGRRYFNKINVLHIKDVYTYVSSDLIAALQDKIPKF